MLTSPLAHTRSAARSEPAGAAGLRLKVSSDFHEFRRVARRIGRHLPAVTFDPEVSELDQENAFWISGFDVENRVVHTQAVRRVDLHGESIGAHLRRRAQLYFPGDERIDPARLGLGQSAGFEMNCHTTCYQGEVWMRPDMRHLGLVPGLVKFGMALALELWWPELIWAILVPAVSNERFARAIGYSHLTAHCLSWKDRADREIVKESLCWVTRQELVSGLDLRAGGNRAVS